jgi:5'-nucleotidase
MSPRLRALSISLLCSLASCGGPATAPVTPTRAVVPLPPVTATAPPLPATLLLSIVGTNDVHGKLASLPVLAGYLANLRAARAADQGAVALIDGGDMFQGTLESNLNEGAATIAAYDALGYTAVTIGNHEFDFGPAGPRSTPQGDDDPRGALLARATEANFPLLTANLFETATGAHVSWPNMPASKIVELGGVRVGILGITTEQTPRTTIAANFRGLAIAPLAETVVREAAALRAQGCAIVLVAAHAGGRCRNFDDPRDLSSCEESQEIMGVARALPAGTVDAIVAGHTHAAVAHFVNGIPVLESFASGRAFGRVDLVLDRASSRVLEARISQPHRYCDGGEGTPACADEQYEGAPVVPDEALRAQLAPAFAAAGTLRDEPLGVTLTAPFERRGGVETALGNLLADLVRERAPGGADVGMVNGGGIRATLPAGPLTYGALYETFPFDNRFATVSLRGQDLRRLLAANLTAEESLLSISGVRVVARCRGAALDVRLFRAGGRASGRPVRDAEVLRVATSDFVATGGDELLATMVRPADISMPDEGPNIRDASAEALRARGGTLRPDDPAIYDAAHPRWDHPGERPVRCGPAPGGPAVAAPAE